MAHDTDEQSPKDVQGDKDSRKDNSRNVKKSSLGTGAICGLGCLAMFLVSMIAGFIATNNCQPGSYEHYLEGDVCGYGEAMVALGIDFLILIACVIIIANQNNRTIAFWEKKLEENK